MLNDNRQLLLVDDEVAICDVITEIAESEGYDTKYITSSAKFSECYSSDMDVVILDLFMPDTDGVELVRYLADQHSRSSIILISGGGKDILRAAKELAWQQNLNVIGTLNKPFRVKDLRDLLNHVVVDEVDNCPSKQFAFTEDDITQALAAQQLVLHYQPQVEMATRRLIGVEALVRWQHPVFGLIPPDQFIPLAEKTGLMDIMTEYVVDAALAAMVELCLIDKNLRISVNVSPKNLKDLSMPERIMNKLSQYQVSPNQLVIEVTETAICENINVFMDILTRLRMKGIKLAIDDFGTGYSSLEMLTKAPFNELKIDQCFVQKMMDSHECHLVASTSILLAQQLGMRVMSEGVETEEAFNALCKMGSQACQGYWISKPLPMDSLMVWAESWQQQAH